MACFWKGILNSLKQKKLTKLHKITDFIKFVKSRNKLQTRVLWNNQTMGSKTLIENYEHVRDYDIKTVNQGYYTSVCDPFLILIADIFQVEIQFMFLKFHCHYSVLHPKYSLKFTCSASHFSIL